MNASRLTHAAMGGSRVVVREVVARVDVFLRFKPEPAHSCVLCTAHRRRSVLYGLPERGSMIFGPPHMQDLGPLSRRSLDFKNESCYAYHPPELETQSSSQRHWYASSRKSTCTQQAANTCRGWPHGMLADSQNLALPFGLPQGHARHGGCAKSMVPCFACPYCLDPYHLGP